MENNNINTVDQELDNHRDEMALWLKLQDVMNQEKTPDVLRELSKELMSWVA